MTHENEEVFGLVRSILHILYPAKTAESLADDVTKAVSLKRTAKTPAAMPAWKQCADGTVSARCLPKRRSHPPSSAIHWRDAASLDLMSSRWERTASMTKLRHPDKWRSRRCENYPKSKHVGNWRIWTSQHQLAPLQTTACLPHLSILTSCAGAMCSKGLPSVLGKVFQG